MKGLMSRRDEWEGRRERNDGSLTVDVLLIRLTAATCSYSLVGEALIASTTQCQFVEDFEPVAACITYPSESFDRWETMIPLRGVLPYLSN